MRLTLQVQTTRKPYTWVDVFKARLIFANRELIVVKGCGTYSFYRGNGEMELASFRKDHPHAKMVPERHGRWRIHPDSLKRVKASLK